MIACIVFKRFAYFLFLCVCLTGCHTLKTNKAEKSRETSEEVTRALESVAGALSNKQISEKEFKVIQKEISQDKEAQSAIERISDALGSGQKIVKYCPVDGKRYDPQKQQCPEHNVPLKILE